MPLPSKPHWEGMANGPVSDRPGPRADNNDEPRSTSHSRSRPSAGPHAPTNEAARACPTAERTMMTRRTLRREEWVTVQGSRKNPTREERSQGGGEANIRPADNQRSPPHHPPNQSDHCGKKQNVQLGKSDQAIFGAQNFGSQPPLSSNVSQGVGEGGPWVPSCHTSRLLVAVWPHLVAKGPQSWPCPDHFAAKGAGRPRLFVATCPERAHGGGMSIECHTRGTRRWCILCESRSTRVPAKNGAATILPPVIGGH